MSSLQPRRLAPGHAGQGPQARMTLTRSCTSTMPSLLTSPEQAPGRSVQPQFRITSTRSTTLTWPSPSTSSLQHESPHTARTVSNSEPKVSTLMAPSMSGV